VNPQGGSGTASMAEVAAVLERLRVSFGAVIAPLQHLVAADRFVVSGPP